MPPGRRRETLALGILAPVGSATEPVMGPVAWGKSGRTARRGRRRKRMVATTLGWELGWNNGIGVGRAKDGIRRC